MSGNEEQKKSIVDNVDSFKKELETLMSKYGLTDIKIDVTLDVLYSWVMVVAEGDYNP